MRLDQYLVEQKLVKTRSKAVHLIKTGNILVNKTPISKQSYNVNDSDIIKIKSEFRYVSRAGYKIEDFFKKMNLCCKDKTILDVGCSTGGFSDYFLQNNVKNIVAIDIAKDIIYKTLLKDPRLKYIEEVDATDKNSLKKSLSGKKFDIISIDVTNTLVEDVLKNMLDYLKKDGLICALFKPHYEGGKGIVSEEKIELMSKDFEKWVKKLYKIEGKEFSPLRGGSKSKGNKELFYLLKSK